MHAQVVEGERPGCQEYEQESYAACDEEPVLGRFGGWEGEDGAGLRRNECERSFGVVHARAFGTEISVAGMALQIDICIIGWGLC